MIIGDNLFILHKNICCDHGHIILTNPCFTIVSMGVWGGGGGGGRGGGVGGGGGGGGEGGGAWTPL